MPTYHVKPEVGDPLVGLAYFAKMELPERLRYARKRAGLTQGAVADHFKIARVSVTQWEGGTSRPDQGKFVELAALFDVPLQWLMDGSGSTPAPAEETDVKKPVRTPAKFIKSSAFRFYVKDWREFMGVTVTQAASAAQLDEDEYQAFETYPINFSLFQIVNLAEVIGVRGDQFWFPPPKPRRSADAPARRVKQAAR